MNQRTNKTQPAKSQSVAGNVAQKKSNNTGLPDNLKSGIESLSGHSMDDVKVHYNSARPAQLQAHAFAQGNQIHLAPGQEKHLPHEAWHVVQQKQGRVKPTMQLKSSVPVNDDPGLEKEADVMGEKALMQFRSVNSAYSAIKDVNLQGNVLQRQIHFSGRHFNSLHGISRDHEAYQAFNICTDARKMAKLIDPSVVYNLTSSGILLRLGPIGPVIHLSTGFHGIGGMAAGSKSSNPKPSDHSQSKKADGESNRKEEINRNLYLLGGAILPSFIIWQTIRDRMGQSARGRAAHAAEGLTGAFNRMMPDLHSASEQLHSADRFRRNPAMHGFKLGFDPRPMPIARRYANFSEIMSSARQIAFLMMGESHHFHRAANVHSVPLLPHMLALRNRAIMGYGAGSGVSSALYSGLTHLTGTGNPLMALQVPWDAFHITNQYALNARRWRQVDNLNQRALAVQVQHAMEKMGKEVIKGLPKRFFLAVISGGRYKGPS